MENLCINARLHLLSGTPTDEQPGWHRTAAFGWSKHIERQTGSYERVPPPSLYSSPPTAVDGIMRQQGSGHRHVKGLPAPPLH